MFIVVSYDISSDSRRTKLMHTLKDFGTRVQYSVFEMDLKMPAFKQLMLALEKIAVPQEDKIRFYFLDADAVARIKTIGMGRPERARDYYIVGNAMRTLGRNTHSEPVSPDPED